MYGNGEFHYSKYPFLMSAVPVIFAMLNLLCKTEQKIGGSVPHLLSSLECQERSYKSKV